MDFSFTVGTREKHQVHFHFNQAFGPLRIKVDDTVAVKEFRIFEKNFTRKWEIPVGSNDRHEVVIEKTRKRIFGGARRQSYRVLVDGELLEEH